VHKEKQCRSQNTQNGKQNIKQLKDKTEIKNPLPHSHQPATRPYPEPDQSSPCLRTSLLEDYFNPLNAELNPICHLLALLGAHHIFHVSGLRVNIILPSTPRSSVWFLSLRFAHQSPVDTSSVSRTCYVPCPSPFINSP